MIPLLSEPGGRSRSERGAKGRAPENTMASFRRGWELGARVAELDNHVGADEALVVMHDETVDTTTTGHGNVKDLTVRQIADLDAGSWFGPEFARERSRCSVS